MKVLRLAVVICAAFVTAGLARPAAAEDEREAFERMRAAFEKAVNEDRFDLLAPYIDSSFKGTSIAGTNLAGVQQIRAFMQRARMLMGTGAQYRLKLIPQNATVDGDNGRASGTTEEEIILPDGQKLSYKSLWSIDLKKRDGKWMVTAADTKVDMRDKLSIAARVIASRIWQAGLNLGRVRLAWPDFDQDRGYYKPTELESSKPAPGKAPKKGDKRT